MARRKALVIVDVQNDFISGSLKIADGEKVVPVINDMLEARKFDSIVYSYDWHPKNHCSFISTWPEHCVQGTYGAELHYNLKKVQGAKRVNKGTRVEVDSYSAFWDNDKTHCTDLHEYLQQQRITDVYVCGLAFDFCVGATAMDAAEHHYSTFVIEDACRGVSQESVNAMKQKLTSKGIQIVTSSQLQENGLRKARASSSQVRPQTADVESSSQPLQTNGSRSQSVQETGLRGASQRK